MSVCAYAKNPHGVLIPAQNALAELSGKLSRGFGGALDYIKKQELIKNHHLESVGQISTQQLDRTRMRAGVYHS
jgi:hypothetical protein